MASIFGKVLEQKKAFTEEKSSTLTWLVWDTHGQRFFVRQDYALKKIENGGGLLEGGGLLMGSLIEDLR